jgi:hypothetical protein
MNARDTFTSDARIQRDRQARLREQIDCNSRPPERTARQLVSVYNGGNMPTQPNYVYLSHPVQLDGGETEGGTGTPNIDTSTTIPVVVLWHPPSVGDLLPATLVGGRWVAERGPTQPPNVTIFTTWCVNCIAPGTITVTITSGTCPGGSVVASGTANSSGQFKCSLPAGTYCVSASTTAANYSNDAGTFTVPSTGSVTAYTPLYPSDLTLTDSALGLTFTVYPNVTPPMGGTNSNQVYWGSQSFEAPATTCCPAKTVTLWYSFVCSNLQATIYTPYHNDSTPSGSYTCPDPAGEWSFVASGQRTLSGQLCYPMNLSATVAIPDVDGVGVWAVADLYGVTSQFFGGGACLLGEFPNPSGVTTTIGVVQ